MSSPLNGGATNAATVSADHQQPEDDIGERGGETGSVSRGREKRSSQRISFISPLRNFCWRGPASCRWRQRLRQPDLLAPGDQLQRQQDRDDLEHMRRAAGGQRQRGHAEQQHEQQREAAAPEHADQPVKRLLAVPIQPAVQLRADALTLGRPVDGWLGGVPSVGGRSGTPGRLMRATYALDRPVPNQGDAPIAASRRSAGASLSGLRKHPRAPRHRRGWGDFLDGRRRAPARRCAGGARRAPRRGARRTRAYASRRRCPWPERLGGGRLRRASSRPRNRRTATTAQTSPGG